MTSHLPTSSRQPLDLATATDLARGEPFMRMCVDLTRAEAGCMYYGWTIQGDKLFCREAYVDAAGVLEHLGNVGPLVGELLADPEVAGQLAVDLEGRALVHPDRGDRDGLVGAGDDRSERETVHGQRCDHQRITGRMDDRATGAHVVRGAAGRGGDDETVAREVGATVSVEVDAEFDHPERRTGGDHAVVEGERPAFIVAEVLGIVVR